MTGSFEIVLPIFILIVGAFVVYLLGRLFQLSNRIMAILAILILLVTLGVLLLQYLNLPDIIQQPEVFFGLTEPGGILYRPSAVGVFILLIGVVIGILSRCTQANISRETRASWFITHWFY